MAGVEEAGLSGRQLCDSFVLVVWGDGGEEKFTLGHDLCFLEG